ncbi:MAG: tetratricopeptide repeat protein [Candidatus Coatesbacteria bacterium]|nr:MAG: tetratricopeptide repeat protein [Candidatus Coatesbacteria bacterium]
MTPTKGILRLITVPAALPAGLIVVALISGCGPERRGADFTYVAREGDTISKVSARYFGEKDLPERIAEHNGLAVNAPLPAGTRLRIPYRTVKDAKADPELIRKLNEARTLAARGDYGAASVALEEVTGKVPDDPAAVYDLGLVSILSGDSAAAVGHLERAVVLAPGDTDVLQALATARANAGDRDGAVEALEEALAADPECERAIFSLGVIYAEADDYENARHYLFEYLLRDNTSAAAERARRLLKEITGEELFGPEDTEPAETNENE